MSQQVVKAWTHSICMQQTAGHLHMNCSSCMTSWDGWFPFVLSQSLRHQALDQTPGTKYTFPHNSVLQNNLRNNFSRQSHWHSTLNFIPLWEWTWRHNASPQVRQRFNCAFLYDNSAHVSVLPYIKHAVTSRPFSKWDKVTYCACSKYSP